eukprot:364649-Chlamydomonas_euryale.AAC.8
MCASCRPLGSTAVQQFGSWLSTTAMPLLVPAITKAEDGSRATLCAGATVCARRDPVAPDGPWA